jgi:rod shape-determining protein MreD
MTAVSILLVLLVAAFTQGLSPAIGWLGMAKAPLILSVVIYYSLSHGRMAMLWAALAGGLMQDSLGFTPLGCSAFCFCLAGLGIQTAREVLFKDSLFTVIGLTALCAALITLVTWLFLVLGEFDLMPEIGGPGWAVWLKAVGTALLACVAAPPVFGLARGLDRLLGTLEASPA